LQLDFHLERFVPIKRKRQKDIRIFSAPAVLHSFGRRLQWPKVGDAGKLACRETGVFSHIEIDRKPKTPMVVSSLFLVETTKLLAAATFTIAGVRSRRLLDCHVTLRNRITQPLDITSSAEPALEPFQVKFALGTGFGTVIEHTPRRQILLPIPGRTGKLPARFDSGARQSGDSQHCAGSRT
jgi:hypothetical protein